MSLSPVHEQDNEPGRWSRHAGSGWGAFRRLTAGRRRPGVCRPSRQTRRRAGVGVFRAAGQGRAGSGRAGLADFAKCAEVARRAWLGAGLARDLRWQTGRETGRQAERQARWLRGLRADAARLCRALAGPSYLRGPQSWIPEVDLGAGPRRGHAEQEMRRRRPARGNSSGTAPGLASGLRLMRRRGAAGRKRGRMSGRKPGNNLRKSGSMPGAPRQGRPEPGVQGVPH